MLCLRCSISQPKCDFKWTSYFRRWIYCTSVQIDWIDVVLIRVMLLFILGKFKVWPIIKVSPHVRSQSTSMTYSFHLSSRLVSRNRLGGKELLDLHRFEEVWLDMNGIEEITSATFSRPEQIRIINLAHNRISSIQPDAFANFSALRELWVSCMCLVHVWSYSSSLSHYSWGGVGGPSRERERERLSNLIFTCK